VPIVKSEKDPTAVVPATANFDGKVQGINDLQREYQTAFGPGNYRPYIPSPTGLPASMVGAGLLIGIISLAGLWLTRPRPVCRPTRGSGGPRC